MISQITDSLKSAKWLRSRFISLSSEERHLLIKSAVLLWAVRVGLWTLPFRIIYNNTTVKCPVSPKQAGISEELIIWAVKVASRCVPCATCLTQAMVARILLSSYGYSADLRIGVAREGDRLTAHAWLEKEGTVIIGRTMCDYKPLPMEWP